MSIVWPLCRQSWKRICTQNTEIEIQWNKRQQLENELRIKNWQHSVCSQLYGHRIKSWREKKKIEFFLYFSMHMHANPNGWTLNMTHRSTCKRNRFRCTCGKKSSQLHDKIIIEIKLDGFHVSNWSICCLFWTKTEKKIVIIFVNFNQISQTMYLSEIYVVHWNSKWKTKWKEKETAKKYQNTK